MSYESCFLENYLKVYYERVFPTSLFCKWIGYSSDETLSRREISFTLKDDVYCRYLSFDNEQDFEKALLQKIPYKIDIGAVYNVQPKRKKQLLAGKLVPEWKELVFDVDMTDYDDIRFCCKGADICKKCWTLMTVAVKIVDRFLREDFGFQHLLWVFSGRRGVHCWVADEVARNLSDVHRFGMLRMLTHLRGGRDPNKRVTLFKDPMFLDSYHPRIENSLKLMRPYFMRYAMKDQAVLDRADGIARILKMLPAELQEVASYIQANWLPTPPGDKPQSKKRWKMLVQKIENEHKFKVVDEIVAEFLYPRLDDKVSITKGHLLKSPFSVHPATGRISVPIDISEIDEFDPMSVPLVSDLVVEIRKHADVHLTSLGKYIDLFDAFISKLSLD